MWPQKWLSPQCHDAGPSSTTIHSVIFRMLPNLASGLRFPAGIIFFGLEGVLKCFSGIYGVSSFIIPRVRRTWGLSHLLQAPVSGRAWSSAAFSFVCQSFRRCSSTAHSFTLFSSRNLQSSAFTVAFLDTCNLFLRCSLVGLSLSGLSHSVRMPRSYCCMYLGLATLLQSVSL